MFSAVKAVAALLRPVSAACRPLIQRVQKYWDVDHCAARFYTDEEYKVIREKEKEAWAAYHKDKCEFPDTCEVSWRRRRG